MWINIDKIRAKREVLKSVWFNLDHSNTPEVKQIIVTMDTYPDRIGEGNVKILEDNSNSYTCFSTHQQNPFLYISELQEFVSGEFELIVK